MKNILSLTLVALVACPPAVFADGGGNFAGEAQMEMRAPTHKAEFTSSPFKACEDKTFLPAKIYNEDKDYWDRVMKDCGAEVKIEVMPDDSFFSIKTLLTKIDGSSEDKAKAKEFLMKVGAQAQADFEFNLAQAKKLEACAKSPKEDGCQEMLNGIAATVKKYESPLRIQLALSNYSEDVQRQNAFSVVEKKGGARENVNRTLFLSGGLEQLLTPAKHHLRDAEMAEAMKIFDEDTSEIEKAWAKADASKGMRPMSNEFRTKRRAEKFKEHTKKFGEMLTTKAPILAYIDDGAHVGNCASSGDAEGCHAVAKAAVKMQELISKSLKDVKKTLAPNGTRLGSAKDVSDLLPLMQHGAQVQELLEKNGEYCQTASGLANMLANKKTKDNSLYMAGLLGGAVVTGVGGGALLGAAGLSTAMSVGIAGGLAAAGVGGASYYVDSKHAQKEEALKMTRASEDSGRETGGDSQELLDAKEALAMNIAMSPATFLGSGISKVGGMAVAGAMGGAFVASFQGAKAGGRLAANAALKRSLREKGYEEEAIKRLFKDLHGKDDELSGKAARTLMREFNYDEGEIDVLRVATSKGLISRFTKTDALKAISDEIDDVDTAKDAIKVLERIDSNKLNEGNRLQVLETALAGVKFGYKDQPGLLASTINEWDQGLDGLAATFKLASKKMDLDEVKNLKVDQRHARAIDLALKEQGVTDDAQRATMAGCALKGR